MSILSWVRKWSYLRTPELPPESTNHEIRNAILGIQLERRRLWQAHESFDARVKAHMMRIEEALKERGG